ncbi:MAG: hypothetical protein L3J67_07510 [Hyphomicrobiaceae bacterium]|nr:hypothetical protein [Hyphomicrobiaceae bacterium]
MVMNTVQQHFPNPVSETDFIATSASALSTVGFSSDNTLPIISVCRDEICASFVNTVETQWGKSFTLGGLGGLPFGGKTGLGAAAHHAPDTHDRERIVVYALTHIGFGPEAEVGGCVRPGMEHLNAACGALVAYSGHVVAQDKAVNKIFTDDGEYGLLIHRMEKMAKPENHTLIDVTNAALSVIQQDITALTEKVFNKDKVDYAVFTGTQIHLPDQNLVQVSDSWIIMNGERQEIDLSAAA